MSGTGFAEKVIRRDTSLRRGGGSRQRERLSLSYEESLSRRKEPPFGALYFGGRLEGRGYVIEEEIIIWRLVFV